MIRNWLRNFMIGRYGPDQLNMALIILSLLIGIVSSATRITVLVYVSYAFLILAMFRMLSRNIPKRRSENDKFLRYWWPFKTKCKAAVARLKSRKTHRFFKCPSCKNRLRVPRGKGRIQITCPKCGERFTKKT